MWFDLFFDVMMLPMVFFFFLLSFRSINVKDQLHVIRDFISSPCDVAFIVCIEAFLTYVLIVSFNSLERLVQVRTFFTTL